MKFKKIISFVILAGVMFACNSPKKEEVKENKEPKVEKIEKATMGATRFEELKGYFVKNIVEFDKDYRFVVVSNQENFDKYFGLGKTMKNEVTALDFNKFNVAGILVKPNNKSGKIEIINYTAYDAKQIVDFVYVLSEDQKFKSGNLMLFKIPKSRTSVDFVSNNKTINIKVK